MNCADCGSPRLATYDSRHIGEHVVRKRKCLACEERFYTIESYMTEEELANIENLRKLRYDTGSESETESTEDAG